MYSFRGFGTLATPPANIQSALQSASAQYNVPLPILQAVAQQESSYNPGVTSSAGAQGLMQIMPGNDASLGLTNPFDAQQSANAGARMLSQLYAQYGNWNTALIVYNEGSGNYAQYGPNTGSQSYADQILANAGYDISAGSMGPTPLPGSTDSTGDSSGDASLFDFSSLSLTDQSGSWTPLAWAGVAVAALGLVMVVQG